MKRPRFRRESDMSTMGGVLIVGIALLFAVLFWLRPEGV